jgi:serine phosphatase RsbU (regulator of sigma subunit)
MRLPKVIIVFLLILFKCSYSTDITFNGTNLQIGTDVQSGISINKNWRFVIGDNSIWSNPKFNDSKWDSVCLPISLAEFEDNSFKGNLWLRSTFEIKESQASHPLSLVIKQYGASEVFIDGKLVYSFGKVSISMSEEENYNPNGIPFSFTIDSAGKHVIAVRFSNHEFLHDGLYKSKAEAFDLKINVFSDAVSEFKIKIFRENIIPAIGIGIFLTLSIFNFILFLFYKRDKSNLYYSLFSAFVSLSFLIGALKYSLHDVTDIILFDKINDALLLMSNFFLLTLVYTFSYPQKPKRFWIVLSFLLLGLVCTVFEFSFTEVVTNVFNIYCIIDVIVLILITVSKKYDPDKRKRKRIIVALFVLIAIALGALFVNKMVSIVIMTTLVLLIVIPVAGIIFVIPLYMTVRHARSFSVTNKNLEEKLIQVQELSAKTIEQEIEKKKILESQNEKLEQMVQIRTIELAEKNTEIKDSINYAKRIQTAMLTHVDEIKEALSNSFILFKPKDIVSGDFYFYAKKDETVFLAAADCTGHGVPGALMSMICAEKLSGATNDHLKPSLILETVNKGIKSTLRQTEQDNSTKDGMDIALFSLNLNSLELCYSGANRPLWIIRNGENKIDEIKATKSAIGGYTPDDKQFELHGLKLNKGDTVYVFTDGFADQFGSTGKKLMVKKFREILLEIQSLTMPEQESYLDNFIESWKNGVEQVDDILVIGVRV